MPDSVLGSLCRWKAEEEDTGERYLFRTDIDDGREVNCKRCTTRLKRLLCDPCEHIFDGIDNFAHSLWQTLEANWQQRQRAETDDEMKMKVAVSSMVARAVCVSLPECIYSQDLIKAIQTLSHNKNFLNKTQMSLNDIGFLWYRLPSDGPGYKNRTYRVEFPFRCAVNFTRQRVRFLTICAQVPPFFCLLPYNLKKKELQLLKRYLCEVAHAVQDKLNEKLTNFIAGQRTRGGGEGTNFTLWYDKYHAGNGKPGPLLVFNYLK